MSLSKHDDGLFNQFVIGVITYEDALRQAESVNDLRLAIKLHLSQRWRDDEEGGVAEVPRPNRPILPLSPGASNKEPDSDT
jgi:Tfp pilus assembly ATPase PilU